MLAILLDLAVCASISIKESTNGKTPFDIFYVNDGKETSITGKQGFYVAFKVHNYDDQLHVLTSRQYDAPKAQYSVIFDVENDKNASCKQVKLSVRNNEEKPLNISLGVFADADFKSDNDLLSMTLNRRAFQIQSKDGSDVVMLIVNGSNYPQVSTLYLGELANSESKDASSYPYFQNSANATKETEDSVFAFSWQNKIIQQGTTDFGFIVVPDTKYTSDTFLYDRTGDINGKTSAYLTFEVIDYDPDDEINITMVLNHVVDDELVLVKQESKTLTKYFWEDKVSKSAYFWVDFEEAEIYEYYAFTTSLKDGYQSRLRPVRVFSKGAVVPKVFIKNQLDRDFNPGDIIYVELLIDDESKVKVSYQFDDMKVVTDKKYSDTSDPGEQLIFKNIPIPNTLTFGEHKLKLWATDEYGLNSDIFTHIFTFQKPDRPVIASLYLSDERLQYPAPQEVILYGTGADPDDSQQVTIVVQIDDREQVDAGHFMSTKSVEPFAIFYTIETNKLNPGRHNLTVFLRDPQGHVSRNKTVLSFLVYDPDQSLPPTEVGRIEDSSSSIPENSNAAFNLKYYDTDGVPGEMTFNNEGFFAAFRVYSGPEGGKVSDTTFVKYNKYFSVVDEVTVSRAVLNQSRTGYKRVQFKVTNGNDWPRKVDLGVFADSDFSGDDNSKISIRPDQRGIVVTNVAKNLHYTVISKDVLNSPSVKGYYLKAVERSGKDPIPLEKIPFFQTTPEVTELSNGNAMYGFHWSETIPAGESVFFAVEFAGHDKVKTPPRVIDNSNMSNVIRRNQLLNFSFIVKDGDFGEQIRCNLTINNELVESRNFTNYGSDYIFNSSINATSFLGGYMYSDTRYFKYEFIAEDLEQGVGLTSNRIYKILYLDSVPHIELDPINGTYNNQSIIYVNGKFTDTDAEDVSIYYQFIDLSYDAKYRSQQYYLGRAYADEIINDDYGWDYYYYDYKDTKGTIKKNIQLRSVSKIISPRSKKWGIVFFAQDSKSGKSNEVYFEFKLNPYDPPELKRAGLSKRYGTRGSTMLGYAIIKDKQVDDLYIYVKIDKNGQYPDKPAKTIRNNEKTGEFKAVAFHWPVPQEATPGDHDVYICVRDSDGLEAEAKPVTFIVQN